MTPKELKNAILQLAIQGKLVEQRPEEGTAAELYAQIQAEKRALIAAGKLKKEKPLPEIADDEKPFDLPEGWMWVRLGEYCQKVTDQVASGSFATLRENVPSLKTPDYAIMVKTADFSNGFTRNLTYTTQHGYEFLENSNLFGGELVLSNIGSIGKCFIVPHLDIKMTLAPNAVMLRLEVEEGRDYLYHYLLSPQGYQELIAITSGTAMKKFNKTDLKRILIPLPPLAEQKRIVAKIEELLPLVDRYEKAWTRLEDLGARFPLDMQKALLQFAIQGKLVEQRPEEGTAAELYAQIQAEKRALIASGKLKKEKPLPEITEDEKPFDIPEGWMWVRIGKIFNLQAGKNITSSNIFEERNPEHPYSCYGGNGVRGYVEKYNREGHFALIGRQGALCGNINYANGKFYATEHAVVVEQFADTDVLWCGYFLTALNLNQYATATAQPGLAVANINQVLIPLPPIGEQKRIVARLNELLPLCEKLK